MFLWPTHLIKATLLSLILLTISVAKADTIDISDALRCDSIVEIPGCISNGESANEAREVIVQNTGIIIPSATGSIPKVETLKITVTPTQKQQIQKLISSQSDPSTTSQQFAANTGAVSPNTGSDMEADNPNNGITGTTASRDNGLNMGAPTVSDYSHNQQLKAGGFLYSEEDSENSQPNKAMPETLGSGANSMLGQTQSSGNSAVEANRKNLGTAENIPLSPVSTSASGFGQFESGSSAVVGPGIVAKVTDGLASIAGSLGEKFFGSLGGKRNGNQGDKRALAAANVNKKAALKKGMTLDRNLLKRGLAQFNAQGTNSLEFGSAQSFLFNSMCNHYVAYARNNRIPNDRSPCPRK